MGNSNKTNHNKVYKPVLDLAYLENTADFTLASTWLKVSVKNHATAHTLNVSGNDEETPVHIIIFRIFDFSWCSKSI